MFVHYIHINARGNIGRRYAGGRTESTKQVGIFKLLLLNTSWAATCLRSQASRGVLLTKHCFILKPYIYLIQGDMIWERIERFSFEFVKNLIKCLVAVLVA